MNCEPKVIVRTVARNAERTLRRTVESIYAQTYDNWELHMTDNASDDGTLSIMEEYAAKDARVRVFKNKGNFVWKKGNRFTDYYTDYDLKNTFLCYLDADDEYKPGFMKDMTAFAREYNLDIACSGYDHIIEKTKEVLGIYKPDTVFVLDGENYGTEFKRYHFFARFRCMKIFRLTVTDIITVSDDFDRLYGGDTFESLEYFSKASRVGFYPEAHYIYNADTISITYKWYDKRPESIRRLHDRTVSYLTEKAGYISPENYTFLCSVYYNELKAAVDVVLSDNKLTAAEKLNAIHDLFVNRYTRELVKESSDVYNKYPKEQLNNLVANWIDVSANEFNDRKSLNKAVEILSVIEQIQ